MRVISVSIPSFLVRKLSQERKLKLKMKKVNGLEDSGTIKKKSVMWLLSYTIRTPLVPNCKEGTSILMSEPAKCLNRCPTLYKPEILPNADLRTRRCIKDTKRSIGSLLSLRRKSGKKFLKQHITNFDYNKI